ncbi:MAG TPA: carboxyl transferase domain-containing protein [Acidimicrobiia bacterium]
MSRRDWDPLLGDLAARRRAAAAMGGDERLEHQRARGRLDARARVTHLLDPGTFVELGPLVGSVHRGVTPTAPADAFVAGHGLVDGRPVLVGAEDFSVMAGSIGPGTEAKRQRLVELAGRERAPLVLLLEGVGERTRNAYELRSRAPSELPALARVSGLVPTVAVVMGVSAGHSALTAALAGFVVMVDGSAMFAAGPAQIEVATGVEVGRDELGGVALHTSTSGVAHNRAADDGAALDLARRYLSFLPSSAWARAPFVDTGDVGRRRVDEVLDIVPVDPGEPYDVREVIEVVADRGAVLEIQPEFGRSMVTALARLGGQTVGVVANQPAAGGGAIDASGAGKAARFLDLADAFHLPVVFLADTPGLATGVDAERAGTLRHAARLLAAQARVRSPKLHVTLRSLHGVGAPLMGQQPFDGQTLCVALPGARHGGIPSAGGQPAATGPTEASVLLEHAELGGAYDAAETLTYDDVVEPGELRDALLDALRLASLRDGLPARQP